MNIHRRGRLWPDAPPTAAVPVRAPSRQEAGGGVLGLPVRLLAILALATSVVLVLFFASTLTVITGGVLVVGSLGLASTMLVRQRSGRSASRARYLAYLDVVAAEAAETARLQDLAGRFVHPGPAELWAIACRRTRLWERAPDHADFLTARVGSGVAPLATPLRLEAAGGGPIEPGPALEAARRLVRERGRLSDQPVLLDLRARPSVGVVGPASIARSVVRAVVTELAVLCSPDDLRIAIQHPPAAAAEWEFAKWLPHVRDEDGRCLLGDGGEPPAELLAAEVAGHPERARTAERESRPHLLLVVDGCGAGRGDLARGLSAYGGEVDASVVVLVDAARDAPGTVHDRVDVERDGGLTLTTGEAGTVRGRHEGVEPALADAIARLLAPLSRERGRPGGDGQLGDLLGLEDLHDLRPELAWRERRGRGPLRVPLGVDAGGAIVLLDLDEPALGGMGPHALVVGATGSGKSELLRTLATALAITSPPEVLTMLLVGLDHGAASAALANLPHVAGVVTGLAADPALADRLRDALAGEQRRRQRLLGGAGDVDSIREYHRLRSSGTRLAPLPHLLVIVDELDELLSGRPELADLLVAIGRTGRRLGIHLLLASQHLDRERLRGLESHIGCRIALRLFDPDDSRAVIGVPDASTLPPMPGEGYLQAGGGPPRRFTAAAVSLPVSTPAETGSAPAIQVFGGRPHALPAAAPVRQGPSQMEVAASRLAGAAPRAHQIWLPELERTLTLDRLRLARRAGLCVPLGLVDRPAEHSQGVLEVDLGGHAAHLLVAGAPRSGKSTLLRTFVLALALTHTPAEVGFYGLDFGGGLLAPLEGLPHVGAVCDRRDRDRPPLVMERLRSLVQRREGPEALFVLIDGWDAFRRELADQEPALLALAAGGAGRGVHLVLTCERWAEVPASLRGGRAERIELRLGEPFESVDDRRKAALVPAGVPGRGLAAGGLHFQAALPRVDGHATAEGLERALADLVRGVAAGWTGPAAPPVRTLPEHVPVAALPSPDGGRRGVPVGIADAEPDFELVTLDLAEADPHFLVFGDGRSGKTTFCRAYVGGLVARSTPDQVGVAVLDYRHALLGSVPEAFLLGYAGTVPAVGEVVGRLHGLLASRLPGTGLSAVELWQRSWRSGRELYVVVDDYELLLGPGADSPLTPLLDFLAQGRDLGFHLVVTHRATGAAAAMGDPVLRRLRDLDTPGILLSGDRSEGPLLGGLAPVPQRPGRGLLVRRGETRLVQLAR